MTINEQRSAVVEKLLSRLNKNQYSQDADKRNLVGMGWGDCSSTVRWCYRQVLGINIGSNTVAQITNKSLSVVEANPGGQPDERNLLPGDLLYFEGTNASRPEKVGHVEMYIGNGKICGHGSGKGPTTKVMKDYVSSRNKAGRRYIKTLRVIGEAGEAINSLNFGDRMLKYGMRGSDVSAMQAAIISLGYSCGVYGADGDFGECTRDAVKTYQDERGLEVDGIVGPVTTAAIKRDVEAETDLPETVKLPPDTDIAVLVTGGRVRVRAQPNTDSARIVTLNEGDMLPYLGATTPEGWHSVSYAGQSGWISGRYGRVVGG